MHPEASSLRGRWWTSWRLWAAAMLLATALASLGGCGTASDNPSDCSNDEFFDEASQLCTACPATVQPQCEAGCGFEVVQDSRGCPVAQCQQKCVCGSGEYFSEQTFSCQKCAEATNPPASCAQ